MVQNEIEKNYLCEELDKNNIKENKIKILEEDKINKDLIKSDIDIIDLNAIKEKLEAENTKAINKNIEKDKVITDIYKIKIDIENPNDDSDIIKNKDNLDLNNKNEKQIEIISKEDTNVNKENVQNNGQEPEEKIGVNNANKEKKLFFEKKEKLENKIIKIDTIINNDFDFNLEENDTGQINKNEGEEKNEKKEKYEENITNNDDKIFLNINKNIRENIFIEKRLVKLSKSNDLENVKTEDKENKKNMKKHNTNINITEMKNYYKSNDDKNQININNKKLSKKEFKTKPINKNIRNIKINRENEIKHKNIFSKKKDRKGFNKSEEKKKSNKKGISPFQKKNLKIEKNKEEKTMEKNKLTKEKYSPITTRSKQVSFFEKKDRVIFKTLESNEKLMIPKKVKKKVEINDKKFKNKKNFNLRINSETTTLPKYYKTELSFKSSTEKLLLKETKLDKKSNNNKKKIISIDNMKNANKIINSKKKTDKLLNNSNRNINSNTNNNRINSNKNNSNMNIYLKRIKETNENNNKNREQRNLISKEIDINNDKDKDSISSSDLGDVGEIIEDEAESEFGNELNELGENNFINNPKSISTYSSSIILMNNKAQKKRFSLSVNKSEINYNNNHSSPLNNNIIQKINEKISYNFKDSKEISDKIKKKENDIEKVKKLIEIVKRNIKYYDKEINEVEKFIQKEEQIRKDYQILINYLNQK